MTIIFTWKELLVKKEGEIIVRYPASCNVRNELNGRRKLHNPKNVVRTFPVKGVRQPYQPRQFPSGIFKITGIEYTDNPTYAPVKIKTNATRPVFLWALDENGGYDHQLEEIQHDSAYWIHYTDSPTTLGCIRHGDKEGVMELAKIIENEFREYQDVFLEVL